MLGVLHKPLTRVNENPVKGILLIRLILGRFAFSNLHVGIRADGFRVFCVDFGFELTCVS